MNENQGIMPLDQVIGEIDESLRAVDDSHAHKLRLAALAGGDTASQEEKYILFSIGSAPLAVPISRVKEIGDLPTITRLPGLPSWVLGIVNVRNEIISVIDFPHFIAWDTGLSEAEQRMIILGHKGVKFGIRIDKVLGTFNRTDDSETVTGTPLSGKAGADFLPEGLIVNDQIYYVLDYDRLLSEERFTKFDG